MIFTADQLVAHLIGDYILQSHDMATKKTSSSFWAGIHALTYTAPFFFVTNSVTALALIFGSHFLVDRFRLARFLVWLKNEHFLPFGAKPMTATGYQEDVPPWLAVWLLIIADNTIHIVCNGLAIWLFS